MGSLFIAGTFVALIISIIIGIAISAVVLFIGALILNVNDASEFTKQYLGKVILIRILIAIVAAILETIVLFIIPSTIVALLVGCAVEFAGHYYITFINEEDRIRKGMSIFYAVVNCISALI